MVGERSAVGAKANAGKPAFPRCLDQLKEVAPKERFAAPEGNAFPRLGAGIHGGEDFKIGLVGEPLLDSRHWRLHRNPMKTS